MINKATICYGDKQSSIINQLEFKYSPFQSQPILPIFLCFFNTSTLSMCLEGRRIFPQKLSWINLLLEFIPQGFYQRQGESNITGLYILIQLLTMSESVRRTFESKQIVSNRNISSNTHITSHAYSAESQMRNGKITRRIETQSFSNEGAPLEWEGVAKSIVYRNASDLQELFSHKNILLDLINQFEGKDTVIIKGKQREDFNKRLLLLENQIEGLLRRKILFQTADHQGGTRQLDYTGLLNEKENQIIELEKKIQNLEERLRRMSSRESELERQILSLNEQLKRKNQIIEHKDKSLSQQVAFSKEMASIIETIRRSSASRNLISDLVIPSLEITDIRASAKRAVESRSSNTEAVKLIREFESAGSKEGSKLNAEAIIEGWILGLSRDSPLRLKLTEGERRISQDRRYVQIEENFRQAADIYKTQLQKIRMENPGIKINIDNSIFSLLGSSGTTVSRVGDVIQIEKMVQKIIEVPVQDARTKHLIHLLATNYKKLFTKYPKLYDQMDSRLSQFFSQELIDVMEVDEIDRIVEVVKYVPQVVKVENVYAYSSEKSRKVEFHLRVLIKALLEEMEKMKLRSGVVPQIDQGVIGMIRQEIMDIVDVDDILKVYRVTPKIVEVQKIVERIVEKIIEVPKIVEVERRIETPVEVKKYEVVQNTVNVPIEVPRFETLIVQKLIEVPRIQERIVEVPKMIEKIVEVIREVPKIVEVQKRVQIPVEVERYRQIEKEIIVPMTEYRNIELVRQKIVATKEIIEKSIPVDQIIEKIVEVRVQVPKIVEVEKIVQKIVERVEYVPAPDIRNHIEIRYEPVDRIIEKVVPIIQVVQEIVQVPRIVQKIVEVHDVIEKPVEVEVIVQKIVYRDRIKEIEKVVQKPVVEYRTIEKIIQKIVQVPIIQEIIKIEKEIIEKPVIQVVQRLVHKEVEIQVPKILYQDRIKEVEKIINHFVKEPEIIRVVEERIIPVQKVIQRIKTVPTIIQKIIQKLVQVPKVVEVQKIVERIVVVPRVIEKIVQVPQIIEKIVEKVIMVPQIVQIQKIVHFPVFQERIVEIDAPRNVYLEVERPVDVVREVLVRDQIYKENTKIQEMISERVVVQNREVPRTIEVEKIVTNIVEQPKIIQITRDIIVPVEIQVPVDRIVQKMVPIEVVHRQIEQVDKFREKIVPIKQEQIKVVEVDRHIDNIIIQERVKQVQKIVPYIQDRIVQVQRLREKIVPVERVIQQIKQVKQIVEKVVDRVAEIPKIYEVQRIVEKRVDMPKIIEVQKIVPQIVKVNQYIERIVQKIIEVPVLVQQLRQIEVEREKIIQVRTEDTKIKQVDRNIEKQVIIEKLKQVTNNIHLIENTLQIVDRIIERNLDPVLVTEERIVEVPHIIEKIVEKIVIMPQIVQVLKYVHEITQKETLGFAVNSEIGIEERKYKDIAGNLKGQLELLIVELRKTKSNNPALRIQIEMIEKFLAEFQSFILYPRIHQIIQQNNVEKIVEKDRPVLVPVESESNLRLQLSKTILIEKLISELKLLKKQNPNLRFRNLDDDVNLIFFAELGDNGRFSGENFNAQMNEFTNSVQRKFVEMGGWSTDHQLMLNSFLQQRFLMANVVKNSNDTIKKTKAISEKRLEELRKVKEERDTMAMSLKNLQEILPGILSLTQKQKVRGIETQVKTIMTSINSMMVGDFIKSEPTRQLGQMVMDARIQSMIREKDDLIIELKDRLSKMGTSKDTGYYETRLKQLSMEKSKIESTHSKCVDQERIYKSEIDILKARIRELEIEIQRARVVSPKESINTRNSITSPGYEKRTQTRVEISRRSDQSESQSEGYGKSYRNYRNYEQTSNYDSEEGATYRSTYQIVGGSGNGKHLMSGSEVGSVGGVGGISGVHHSTAIGGGGKISSQHYISGTSKVATREFASRNELETGSNSYNKMQMSSVSSSSSPRNVLNSNGKKYEMYYETKYEQK